MTPHARCSVVAEFDVRAAQIVADNHGVELDDNRVLVTDSRSAGHALIWIRLGGWIRQVEQCLQRPLW